MPPSAHGVKVISIGMFTPGQRARGVARPDAAPRAAAVPRRRLLGRPRRPAAGPAARHRRHRDLGRPAGAERGDPRRHHARSRPPPRSPSAPAPSRCRPTRGSSASSRTCRGSPCPTARGWSRSAPAAAATVAEALTRSIGAPVPLLGQIPMDTGCARAATTGRRSCCPRPDSPAAAVLRSIAEKLAASRAAWPACSCHSPRRPAAADLSGPPTVTSTPSRRQGSARR